MTQHPGADLARTFGATVCEMAESRGWDVKRLADRAGIVPTQLRRMMNGDDAMNTDHMVKLSWALGVGVSELLTGAPREPDVLAAADAAFDDSLRRAEAQGWLMQGA